MMKKSKSMNGKSGQTMTEMIIIVAIIAIGSLVAVGLFGQQIKTVFAKLTGGLSGTQSAAADQNGAADSEAGQNRKMGTFDDTVDGK